MLIVHSIVHSKASLVNSQNKNILIFIYMHNVSQHTHSNTHTHTHTHTRSNAHTSQRAGLRSDRRIVCSVMKVNSLRDPKVLGQSWLPGHWPKTPGERVQ